MNETLLGIKDIMRILPHRYPFLLVDRIIHLDLENNIIIGQKNLTMNEAFFQGHFPGMPIMPGVLILEALAQTGGILAYEKGFQDQVLVLLTVDEVKFRRPVYPGDVLYLRVEGTYFGSKGAKVKAEARINEIDSKPVAQCKFACALVERSQI